MSWAGHRHIHGKQALTNPFLGPDTPMAFLPSSPGYQASNEVPVVIGFEHKRRSMGLPLARMNRAELDVQHSMVLKASEGIHCTLYSALVQSLQSFRYPSKVALRCLGLFMHSSKC
ncbi:hypothetical protein D3C84_777640 [compost metagenome]